MPTPCYLLEATDVNRRALRRYTDTHGDWTCAAGWHEARTPIEDGPRVPSGTHGPHVDANENPDDFASDGRWPTHCAECGYAFTDADARQVFTRRIYRVAAVVPGSALAAGAETTIDEAPPGAMWYAVWMGEWAQGPDGRTLMVKLPDGHNWTVDGEATNCTRKGDRTHRCWIRHGTPRRRSLWTKLGKRVRPGRVRSRRRGITASSATASSPEKFYTGRPGKPRL